MKKEAAGSEQPSQGANNLQAGCKPRKMVQYRKGEGVPESLVPKGSLPPRDAEVPLEKARPQRGGMSSARLLQEGDAEIQPHIGAAVASSGQAARQFPIAASDVQHGGILGKAGYQAFHTGLDALPGGGKLLPEGLVKLAVERQESLSGFGIHARHYTLMTSLEHTRQWLRVRRYTPEKLAAARRALEEVRAGADVVDAIRRNPLPEGGHPGKHMLVAVYRQLVESGEWQPDPALLARIRMKPTRTLSGVTTVTVLTKPYPCPGKCIFCPTDVRMPKSYLPDEPGAMRGLQHEFDPYAQVRARLRSLAAVGHPVNKIELLVLGGTWSAYRREYREWFIRRCFDALNEVDSETLEEAQRRNETAAHRSVGLVVETRPDHVTLREIEHMRRLGVTKVQLGAQSLDDRILGRNQRGHTVADTRRAVALLRAAGFKVVLHWMPNLLGATPQSDREDFARFWSMNGTRMDTDEARMGAQQGEGALAPDELKIYPTQLLANADLYAYWQRGEYQPYDTETLIDLLAEVKTTIPRYCRVNRVIRDIPSTHVVEGNKRTSLRQDVHREMARRGTRCQCIRCREVRGQKVVPDTLRFDDLTYRAGFAEEHFLSFNTPDDKLAAFLRLSLPGEASPDLGFADLEGAAIIREVHVYGQSLEVGREAQGAAQHIGLGRQLIARAEEIARSRGYRKLAVIAAVGTRRYYAARGFRMGDLYMVKEVGQ